MRVKSILLFSFLVFLVSGCGGEEMTAPTERTASPVTAETMVVKSGAAGSFYEAVGTVKSETVSTVSAKVMGTVQEVHFEEGSRVRRGDLLVEIDSRDSSIRVKQAEAALAEAKSALEEIERTIQAAESSLEAARANAALAQSTYERFKQLVERNSISRQEFDEVEARWKSAQAGVQEAEERIESIRAKRRQVLSRIEQAESGVASAELVRSYTRVTAPFSGVVSGKMVEVGQLASPGAPLLTLEDPGNFEVEAVLDASRIGLAEVGSPVEVVVDSLGESLQGTVREIMPRADPSTRSIIVKVDIPSVPELSSGLFARTRFEAPGTERLTVPAGALLHRGQLVGVFIVDDEEKARFRLVQVGRKIGDEVEILAGLSPGIRIVVSPLDEMQDGVPLRIARTERPRGNAVSVFLECEPSFQQS